ncbi:MAG: type II toxin-antitoxin system ParD family antitoxin [Flavobacteriales bacterium]|jgi:antitoxin ParD1/3/4
MARQSITLTQPNDDWLNDLVMRNEYASKSEVVNDLIRRAREEQERLQLLRLQLQQGEESGFIEVTKEELQNALRQSLDEDNDLLIKP